jgi:hypothetical protein
LRFEASGVQDRGVANRAREVAMTFQRSELASHARAADLWALRLMRLASLLPFALAAALHVLAASYFGRGLGRPPEVAGIPLGIVIDALALAWAALAVLVAWRSQSRIAVALVVAFVTLPSMLVILFGPAAILILQNLP